MEESKQCRNCRYFIKHYVGNSNITFVFADNVCTKQMPVYVKEEHYCGYWEEREEENEAD